MKIIRPPKLADKLFEWYCANANIEDLHGDMEELFFRNLESMPAWRAKQKYWTQTLSLIFSYAIKKRKQTSSLPSTSYHFLHYNMIRHYVKIASRNMLKNKAFSMINIFGLSIGITCCVLLTLFIRDELSYDKHFKDADRIYRLTTTMKNLNGTVSMLQRSSPAIGPGLTAELPEFELSTRVVKDLSAVEQMIKYKDQVFFEKRGYQVDTTFFQMFPYEFREGNSKTALKELWSVILSADLAHKLFGNNPALNELISIPTLSDTGVFRVTGVIKRTSSKSHLDADFYVSGLEEAMKPITTWATANFVFIYFKVKEGVDVQQLVAKFPALVERHGGKENEAMGRKKILGLQSLADVHLHSRHFDNDIELGTSGSITYVYLTAAIGLLILILASINFVNLTTVKAAQRASEIGVRKAIGAQRANLFLQFVGESMGVAFVAMIVAAILIYLTLPYFNNLVQKDIEITLTNAVSIVEALLAFALITGFVAGIYPSLVLSSFDPIKALKDKQVQLGSSNYLRKGLIAFQFMISIALISAILVIQNQLHFIQEKPLGFDPTHKIMVPLRTADATNHYAQFKNAVKSIPGVAEVTASSNSPSTPPTGDWNFYPAGKTQDDGVGHYIVVVDENYFKMMSIPSTVGRDFIFPSDAAKSSDVRKVIVNRASLSRMGIDPSQAVGARIVSAGQNDQLEIVGVIENFHQFSLHKTIGPILFYASADSGVFRQSIIGFNAEITPAVVDKIKQAWTSVIPDTPFESELLDDTVQRQYESDRNISSIIFYATCLAVIISCLGLYGLSIFIAERRKKEIGIRKVMGASINGIVMLLSKEFVAILVTAFFVAAPISYIASQEWLKTFAYQVDIGPGLFVFAGLLSFLVVILATAFESWKAAKANPANSLKVE